MYEDEDSIVEEIPVYLSKGLAQNLFVVQFPIKNKNYNIDNSNVVNCCVKPTSQQVKIDFKVDTASRNYDAFKGKMLAETADGHKSGGSGSSNNKPEHKTFESGRMDKVSFVSSISVQNPRYALGMMVDKELHLVPVKTFYQMRQNYSYFDKGDKRTKAESKAEHGSDEESEDLKQITVKFARSGDAEKIKKARERSYHFISHIGADEPWCETMIYPKTTSQSEIERQKIPLSHHSADGNFTGIPANEYFEELISDKSQALVSNTDLSEKDDESKVQVHRVPISKKQVKKLPLLEQIKIFLRDAKILSFNSLMEQLSDPQLSVEKVLRNLTLCGVMLRGNWTLQSEVVYPPGFVSLVNGVSAELMCRGRDYILYKIMKNELSFLNRQKISVITQLPQEETKEILESVAYLRVTEKKNKIWDLLKTADYDFEKRHPEIVQRQETFWKAQEEKFLEMESEKAEKRTRKRSVRESKV